MAEYKRESKLYTVIHEVYSTDRYVYGSTLVRADSKEDAMNKLNDYLRTKPDGVYTALLCKSIESVFETNVLE
jgi:hypothetical protein